MYQSHRQPGPGNKERLIQRYQHLQHGNPVGPQRNFNGQQKARWNEHHNFDAGLDFLRANGLNQDQYSNLQGGNLPGGMHGLFRGMTPAQLKQVASFVNSQGTAGDSGKVDPITGAPIPGAMHFGYNDPRLQHGEAADEQATVAPWMQAPGAQGGPGGYGQPIPPGGFPIQGGPVYQHFPGVGGPPQWPGKMPTINGGRMPVTGGRLRYPRRILGQPGVPFRQQLINQAQRGM